MNNVQQPAERVIASVERVIVGKHVEVRMALVALLCEGHILIEDVPGVGKTMLAKALSQSIGCSFRRIQFTPDLLPSDVLGVSMQVIGVNNQAYAGAATAQTTQPAEPPPPTSEPFSRIVKSWKPARCNVTGDSLATTRARPAARLRPTPARRRSGLRACARRRARRRSRWCPTSSRP